MRKLSLGLRNSKNGDASKDSKNDDKKPDVIEPELYYLIARFLSQGPCKEIGALLEKEIEKKNLLPPRVDWEGGFHPQTFEDISKQLSHISPDHLLRVCHRVGPVLDRDVKPVVNGVKSLLGAGRQSMLRTEKDALYSRWTPSTFLARRHRKPLLLPHNLIHPPGLLRVSAIRQISEEPSLAHLNPSSLYEGFNLYARTLGHLSSVYCLTYDRTGRYIITGADDGLVKIWIAHDGRLTATLRGHSAEIADLAVNYENTLLATGSCDKTVRVWCLKTCAPVAILQGHTGVISMVHFSPMARGAHRFLVSTGLDGCVCFWSWNIAKMTFDPKPLKFVERSRAGAGMRCSSFSPGGIFLATGNSDSVVRVYCMSQSVPEKICELEAHADRVDSIQYSHQGDRFISGSKDGTAKIWYFRASQWQCLTLNMAAKLKSEEKKEDEPSTSSPTSQQQTRVTRHHSYPIPAAASASASGGGAGEEGDDAATAAQRDQDPKFKPQVTMVVWSCDDTLVATAVNDFSIKIWNSHSGSLIHSIKGHKDEVYTLEAHPFDPKLLVSAGHDGGIFVWDIETGVRITRFQNSIEGQGFGAVFDLKWASAGHSFAATDSHGHLLVYGLGQNDRYKRLPKDMFFHTDYRPLIRDANLYCIDEQTQTAPHLMPPPFLVDLDGNPHRPEYQKLVPGRERCRQEQLIPHIVDGPGGSREVFNGVIQQQQQQQEAQTARTSQQEADAAGPAASAGDDGESTAGSSTSAAAVVPPVAAPGPMYAADGSLIDQAIERLEQEQDAILSPPPPPDVPSTSRGFSASSTTRRTRDDERGRTRSGARNLSSSSSINRINTGTSPRARGRHLSSSSSVNHNATSPGAALVGMRRTGETEGVRQALGNVAFASGGGAAVVWQQRVVIPPLSESELKASEEERHGRTIFESGYYVAERRKKPPTEDSHKSKEGGSRRQGLGSQEGNSNSQGINRLTARALYDTETEDSDSRGERRRRNGVSAPAATTTTGEDSEGHVSLQTDDEQEEHVSSSNDNETTDISDWEENDEPVWKHKKTKKKRDQKDGEDEEEEDEGGEGRRTRKRRKKRGEEDDATNSRRKRLRRRQKNKNDSYEKDDEEEEEEDGEEVGSPQASTSREKRKSKWRKSRFEKMASRKNRRRRRGKDVRDDDYGGGDGDGDGDGDDDDNDDDDKDDDKDDDNKDSRKSISRRRGKDIDLDDDDDDGDDNDNNEDVEGKKSNSEKKRNAKKAVMTGPTPVALHTSPDFVIPDSLQLPDWITTTIPRKAPYIPQLGDAVVYFRQGHEQYVNAVLRLASYEINPTKGQPWHKNPNLREHELVKIIGIKYEIHKVKAPDSVGKVPKGPRLVLLRLQPIDQDGYSCGKHFTVKYHDMNDVVDFLVLRQMYDLAMSRQWKVADRFRCVVDDAWWSGTIVSQQPFQLDFPDSMFQCFTVRWANNEVEKMSPWDFEPIDESRLNADGTPAIIDATPVTRLEYQSMLYAPSDEDWFPNGQDAECFRLISGIEQLLEIKKLAANFGAPVCLQTYPMYALMIAYPIDLTTIKQRVENRFYRQKAALRYDVTLIKTNAEIFNADGSMIVTDASMVVQMLLWYIDDPKCVDIMPLYHRITKEFAEDASSDEDDMDASVMSGTSTATPAETRKRKVVHSSSSSATNGTPNGVGPSHSKRPRHDEVSSDEEDLDPNQWKAVCLSVLEDITEMTDAEPFRNAVDPDEYLDYLSYVDKPMDLTTVRHQLISGYFYNDPTEFAADVDVIFKNSKRYNTDVKSKIYAMTIRLSGLFKEMMEPVVNQWERAKSNSGNSKKLYKGKSGGKGGVTKNGLVKNLAKSYENGGAEKTSHADDDVDSSAFPNNFAATSASQLTTLTTTQSGSSNSVIPVVGSMSSLAPSTMSTSHFTFADSQFDDVESIGPLAPMAMPAAAAVIPSAATTVTPLSNGGPARDGWTVEEIGKQRRQLPKKQQQQLSPQSRPTPNRERTALGVREIDDNESTEAAEEDVKQSDRGGKENLTNSEKKKKKASNGAGAAARKNRTVIESEEEDDGEEEEAKPMVNGKKGSSKWGVKRNIVEDSEEEGEEGEEEESEEEESEAEERDTNSKKKPSQFRPTSVKAELENKRKEEREGKRKEQRQKKKKKKSSSDDEDEDDYEEGEKPSKRKPKRKVVDEDDSEASSASPVRLNRRVVHESDEDDEEAEEEEEEDSPRGRRSKNKSKSKKAKTDDDRERSKRRSKPKSVSDDEDDENDDDEEEEDDDDEEESSQTRKSKRNRGKRDEDNSRSSRPKRNASKKASIIDDEEDDESDEEEGSDEEVMEEGFSDDSLVLETRKKQEKKNKVKKRNTRNSRNTRAKPIFKKPPPRRQVASSEPSSSSTRPSRRSRGDDDEDDVDDSNRLEEMRRKGREERQRREREEEEGRLPRRRSTTAAIRYTEDDYEDDDLEDRDINYSTRNRGRRTIRYREESDAESGHGAVASSSSQGAAADSSPVRRATRGDIGRGGGGKRERRRSSRGTSGESEEDEDEEEEDEEKEGSEESSPVKKGPKAKKRYS